MEVVLIIQINTWRIYTAQEWTCTYRSLCIWPDEPTVRWCQEHSDAETQSAI